jgi:hypothetical protein
MAEWQKEWQNGQMAEMDTYVLFMVHADTDDKTQIFYSIEIEGTCKKIIRKPNNFPVKHRRIDKFLNYLSHKNSFLCALRIINISK